nr:SBBP repeat-containing protein [Nostocaceae cyanobacterium]
MEEDLLSALSGLSLAIYTPGSDVATAQRPNEIVLGRTGNDFVTGLQPLATNPNPPQVQIDILAGDLSIEDPAMRQWNNTFALGDWQQPYYANNGINDLAVILDFNAAKDTIQLYGNSRDYQVLNFGIASAIVYEKPTGPDVIGVVLGSNLDLNASYFEYRGTTPPPGPAVPQIQQLGSIGFDAAHAITTDPSGNVYVGGGTTGSIGGTNAGQFDGFFTKYDSQGNQLFSKQLGTSTYEEIFGTRTDNQGNLYVSGLTDGALGGPKQAQQYDAFVAKYDSNGNQQWIQQVGQNYQFPTFDLAVNANTGDSYISGPDVTYNLQNPDTAYIIKFDSNGNKQWQTNIATSSGILDFVESYGVAVSQDGNVLATGWTNGNLAAPNQGLYDNWVAKLDSTTGATQWIAQYGTPDYEWSWGVASDSQNNVYTTGWTLGNLGGQNAGSFDAYLAKFDSQGNQQWIQQFGTASDDEARAISIDANNNIFLTGYTTGNLGGTNAGSFDAWVAEYDTNGNQK